jgi:alkylation response protein AidB-like acyl-CoA dehydrogenase
MDLNLNSEDLAFRDEVRAFLKDKLDPKVAEKVARSEAISKDEILAWQKALYEQGWIVPNWPVEHGGTGWSVMQRYIFDEECAAAGAPQTISFGFSMIGPVLIAFGSEDQKARYLPRIRSSEDWWCQGFSEPGSGSDLASLRTRAERDGDEWVINGQKTWTTLAQHADMMFCLCRTDPDAKPQRGISMFVFSMNTPGISVRPIRTIDGGTEVNDVFLDNVRVPADALVGEENKGWSYAKYLLSNERFGIARVPQSKYQLKQLKNIAGIQLSEGAPLIEDRDFRTKIADVELELKALEITNLRVMLDVRQDGTPNPLSSMLKIKGSEVQQRISELLMEALGPYGLAYQPHANDDTANTPVVGPEFGAMLTPKYLNNRKISIYGGTNEIQRNIMTKAVLGL